MSDGVGWTIGAWNYREIVRDRTWLRGVTLAAVLIAMIWFCIVNFNDHAFTAYSRSAPASAQTATGQRVFVGLPIVMSGDEASISINLRSVTPRVSGNSARATVQVMECSGAGASALIHGAASDAANVCTTLSPYQRGTIRLADTSGIVLAVTPRRAGTVRISGVDVNYWHGIRFGHQHVGSDWTITAS